MRIRTLWADLAEAVRVLARQPLLIGTIGLMMLVVVTGEAPVVLLRPWVAQRAGGGVQTLSFAYSAMALGMFLTVALLSAIRVGRAALGLVYGGLAMAGLIQVGMALATAPWQVWLLDFLLGVSVMLHGVIWPSLLQERVPPEAMGRVAAIDEFGSMLLYPAGVALIGALLTGNGPYLVLLVGGLLTMTLSLVGGLWLLRRGAAAQATS